MCITQTEAFHVYPFDTYEWSKHTLELHMYIRQAIQFYNTGKLIK